MENSVVKKKTIAIIGAKGFGNYGGYETFIDKLTEYHKDDPDIQYIVACKANGKGAVDENLLQNVQILEDDKFIYHNAYCFKVKVPEVGPAQAILYDLKAANYCLKYFRKNDIHAPILYILTCRIGPFIRHISAKLHKMGGQYIINPDGHEWMRSLWPYLVKQYWKYSEKQMIKYSDKVVCDSINIQKYIEKNYEKFNPKTAYIAYGSELAKSTISDDNKKIVDWNRKWGIQSKSYFLIVGRFVPENNYETMIREFMKCHSKKKLIVITNTNVKFLNKLEKRLHFSRDKRICFVGTVYDKQLLKKIRENAYAYLHGHEVGGTNPSLLEALGSTDINLLLDVGFNEECGKNGALYWNKEQGNLSNLLDYVDKLSNDKIQTLGFNAKNRISTAYTWEFICNQYKRLFNDNDS